MHKTRFPPEISSAFTQLDTALTFSPNTDAWFDEYVDHLDNIGDYTTPDYDDERQRTIDMSNELKDKVWKI